MRPELGPEAFQTYAIRRIPGVHTRRARCEEVGCRYNRDGWETRVDVGSELGKTQARYIINKSGRKFGMKQVGNLVTFTFKPGQQCFSGHTVNVEREPLFLVKDGDHRGNPTGRRRVHQRAQDWVEDMGEHLEKVREQRERG